MTYSQKFQDPRWQKIRLKVFERDDWTCQQRECRSGQNSPLAVHHKSYKIGKEPWEYPLDNFLTLCQKYHEKTHGIMAKKGNLVEGNLYHWSSLAELLGFEPQGYLTEEGDNTLCGCFRLDYNPDAPNIVLPGDKSGVVRRAKKFSTQRVAVPVFIKAPDAHWEYCGKYRVEACTTSKTEIGIHAARSKRKDKITMVLFLEKAR